MLYGITGPPREEDVGRERERELLARYRDMVWHDWLRSSIRKQPDNPEIKNLNENYSSRYWLYNRGGKLFFF